MTLVQNREGLTSISQTIDPNASQRQRDATLRMQTVCYTVHEQP